MNAPRPALLLVACVFSPCLLAQTTGSGVSAVEHAQLEAKLAALAEEVAELRQATAQPRGESWYERFRLGGYGEAHANFRQGGDGGDKFDIHRFVLYTGYRFSDWVQLHSETELEHGFVEGGEDSGEVKLEQFYVEFQFSRAATLRAGRQLNPLGIVNQRHEPTLFNGVERPSVERDILPTTWFQDGVGVLGELGEDWRYEVQLSNGLDGEGFSSGSAIRGGRMQEQPSLHDLALSGRIDWQALPAGAQALSLRVGLGLYSGGADNGNEGADNGVDSRVDVAALDFEASWSRLDFRGVLAEGRIDGAEELNDAFGKNVGEAFGGWYLETACHVLPESWQSGRLADSDAIVFVRYEDFDSQRDEPDNATENAAAEREEITFGVNFYPVRDVVVKVDYQYRESEADADPANLFNLGVGFRL